MKLLIRMFGNDELEIRVYNHMTVIDFLKHIESFSGQELRNLRVRSVD